MGQDPNLRPRQGPALAEAWVNLESCWTMRWTGSLEDSGAHDLAFASQLRGGALSRRGQQRRGSGGVIWPQEWPGFPHGTQQPGDVAKPGGLWPRAQRKSNLKFSWCP